MACLFLDNLPSEIRKQIYEYVLDFDDVPLRHATQLQPFVKKLTGPDGELPFQCKSPSLAWDLCDLPFADPPVSVDILCTSKLIYTEAIKVFYDQNIISVDIELFKLANVTSPDAPGSDLSLAKRLVVKFNKICDRHTVLSRGFNAIDLKTFLPRTQAIFPQVSNIAIHVDGTVVL